MKLYSSYIDFKRAKFVHVETRYEDPTPTDKQSSSNTGRINYMSFKSKK